jgi:hypothetical protein
LGIGSLWYILGRCEHIEGRKAGNNVIKFRGVGIADEEIVHYKGEGSRVSVVMEEHGGKVLV